MACPTQAVNYITTVYTLNKIINFY